MKENPVVAPVTDGADAADVTSERGVTLKTPLVLGNKKITYVEITPAVQQAGSLRGLSLLDVLNMKTDAMFELLPRVTSPRLDEVMLKRMGSADFIQLCGVAVNFLAGQDSGGKSGAATAG
ncbi:phage tail protein [Escherichia coli]|uniref:phage tail protein n=1 Tax=Escherichia coli TaxID=562 RepID=UPI000A376655|nr:phage tail protein [Escherichia coli]MDF8863366.1 phage tail protein [Escherichia coli]OUK49719.1 phage tail protein [Escherichia coli]HBC8469417.1 phage tail protein [Escherichia coli]